MRRECTRARFVRSRVEARAVRKGVSVLAERKALGEPEGWRRVRVPRGRVVGFLSVLA